MEEKIDISIVIPFRNEEDSLKVIIPSLLEVISSLKKRIEIIFIDDVSYDKSVEVVEKFQEVSSHIRLIKLPKRGGQTGCFRVGFKQAQGDYIIRMDADLQDDPRDIPLFLRKIDEGAELIVGLRECRKHSRIFRIASGVYDLLVILLFNSPLHSNAGSYIAFKAKFVKNIPFKKNDHRHLPLIAIRRGAKNISEVFVRHAERKYGESKYKPLKKLTLGIPEVFLFLYRYMRGYYNCLFLLSKFAFSDITNLLGL